MNKTFYYYFGYSTASLNWQVTFSRAANVVVYNDAIIDRVLGTAGMEEDTASTSALATAPATTIGRGSNSDVTQSDTSDHEQHDQHDNHDYNQHDQPASSAVSSAASSAVALSPIRNSTRMYYIITNEKITNADVTYTNDFVSTQDIENIIIANKLVYIKGFLFIRRRKYLIDQMVNSACDNDFNETSTKLGLDTWKYEFYHKKFLFNKMNRLVSKTTLNTVYDIKRNHPLIRFFQDFVRACFKVVNKRVFSIIIIGNTKIGKSICFKECMIDSKYIEYHNNMLEFSKCTDENKKLFRLMDDINWNTVDVMTLKSILNRNVSSVDVKYSYGIIYPMINIFLMNKEDYAIFQRKYVDIWSFISNNVSIYPRQLEKEITEETVQLYDQNSDFTRPLFDDIMDIRQYESTFDTQIKSGVFPNIYECIKSYLINDQPYIYDNRQFLDISTIDINLLPNRQLIVNEMNQKIKEVETEEKYKQKVQSALLDDTESESEEDDKKSQFNRKGCLDYYFKKHAKKAKREANKPRRPERTRTFKPFSKASEPRVQRSFNTFDDDRYMDEDDDMDDDIDDGIGRAIGIGNDNVDEMDDYSDDLMNESFNV